MKKIKRIIVVLIVVLLIVVVGASVLLDGNIQIEVSAIGSETVLQKFRPQFFCRFHLQVLK